MSSFSFFWGKMADIYGRRPVLILGGIGIIVSTLGASLLSPSALHLFQTIGFGLSVNLLMAVVSRGLCGLLNGNIGVVKAYLGEITDSSNQSRAFGLVGLVFGFGQIGAFSH